MGPALLEPLGQPVVLVHRSHSLVTPCQCIDRRDAADVTRARPARRFTTLLGDPGRTHVPGVARRRLTPLATWNGAPGGSSARRYGLRRRTGRAAPTRRN